MREGRSRRKGDVETSGRGDAEEVQIISDQTSQRMHRGRLVAVAAEIKQQFPTKCNNGALYRQSQRTLEV